MAKLVIEQGKTELRIQFNGVTFAVKNAQCKAWTKDFNATFETAYSATTAFDNVLNHVVSLAKKHKLPRLEAGKLACAVFNVDSMTTAYKGDTDDIKAKNKFIESRWLYVSRIQIPTAAQLALNPSLTYDDISEALNDKDVAELKGVVFKKGGTGTAKGKPDTPPKTETVDVTDVKMLANSIASKLPSSKALDLMLALYEELSLTAEECQALVDKVKPQAPTN